MIFGAELSAENFTAVVQHPAWIPINLVGLIASFMVAIGLTGIFIKILPETKWIGIIGYILVMIGVIWFGAIQYYETVLWPLIADYPVLFAQVGFLTENTFTFIMFILSGVVIFAGFILFGIELIRSKKFGITAVLFFALGWIIFGIGMSILIRSIGMVALLIGTVLISLKMVK
jgi:hypothetical protein